MTVLISILLPVCLLALLAGLIKPSWVLFRGKRTRKQVLLIYGSAVLVLFVLLAVFMPKDNTPAPGKAGKNDTWKQGTIAWKVDCAGENAAGVKFFKTFSPEKIDLSFTGDTLMLKETGGSAAQIFADSGFRRVYFLDSTGITRGKCTDLEKEFQDEKVRKLMPEHYRAALKETSADTTLCGYHCRKYEVVKSGFVRGYAKAEVWITNEILLPQLRFDFHAGNRRVLTPLPLQIGVDGGTVLRMRVNEDKVVVTYTVTAISGKLSEKPLVSLKQ